MKKIKYFLVLLVLGLLIPISNSFGYEMWDLWSNYRFCNGSTYPITNEFYVNPSYQNQYYNTGNGYIGAVYDSSLNLDYASPLVYSRNSWYHYKNLGGGNMSCNYVSYPLVGIDTNNQNGLIFKYFVDGDTPSMENFVVESRAGFQHTFNDGYSCVMDQVYFNVGSIIFKCSDSDRTYQILAGGYTLGNHILYVDIVNSSNNVWWISWAEKKAWSITVSQAVRSQIVYGGLDINQSFLENMFKTGYISYTILDGGNNIWPTCGLASCTPQSDDGSPGYIYSRDLVQVAPDFGGGDNDEGYNDPVFIDDSASYQEQVNNYYSCVDLYSDYNVVANSFVLCRQDYINNRVSKSEYNSMINYVKSSEIIDDRSWTGYTTSETGVNCTLLVENARSMAKRQFIDKGLILSDYISVITKLENSGNNPYDLTSMCGSKPTNAGTGVSSNDCNLSSWQNIVNCFGGGSQTTSGSDSSLFSSAVENIKIMVGNTFDNTFLDPIKDKFDEGYNYLTGGVSCTTESLEIPYINLLVYVMAMLIFFSLYKIL